MQNEGNYVLRVGQIIDGVSTKPLVNQLLWVKNERIERIASETVDELVNIDPESEILDLSQYTLMSGIVDAHVHFFGVPSDSLDLMMTENDAFKAFRVANEAMNMLKAGITAARCLGSSVSPSLKRAIDAKIIPGPRLVVAGQFICSTNGTWDHLKLPVTIMREAGMIADGVSEIRQRVRERLRQGVGVIKVGLSIGAVGDIYHAWGDDPDRAVPSYTLDEIIALTEEAHKNRIKVSAHCIGDEAVNNALDGDVDVIEHGYPITTETRKKVVDKGILITTTASQLYYHNLAAEEFGYSDDEKKLYLKHEESMKNNFQLGIAAGVRYCLGTDLIGPPTHSQDLSYKEFEIAVNWGMTPMEAIIAGTKISAEALGLENDIGTVEVGKYADLIAMKSNPLDDIRVLSQVEFVMKSGIIIRHDGASFKTKTV
jgi:imidazolonepropionase-like amidohydrolase